MEGKTGAEKTRHRARQVNRRLMIGICCKGPRRCLRCGREFGIDDTWWKILSPADRVFGRYAVGIHQVCPRPAGMLEEEAD